MKNSLEFKAFLNYINILYYIFYLTLFFWLIDFLTTLGKLGLSYEHMVLASRALKYKK